MIFLAGLAVASLVIVFWPPATGRASRLNFYYLGQRSALENFKEEIAWFLYNREFRISEQGLRRTPVRDITTGWIHE